MDLRLIKQFIVISELKSISRAAERLHISQPPLTRNIKSLEKILGVQLFTRTPFGVNLTQAGEMFLSKSRDIITHAELAVEHTRSVGKGYEGRFDIGAFGLPVVNIIPKIIMEFNKKNPNVNVILDPSEKEQQLNSLKQGRISVAFDYIFPLSPELIIERVCDDSIVVAINKSNPISNKNSINLADLFCEPQIVEPSSCIFSMTRSLFMQYGLEPVIGQKSTGVISTIAMVSGGYGCALVPGAAKNIQMSNVIYRPLIANGEILINLYCAYRKNDRSPLLDSLLDTIRKCRAVSSDIMENSLLQTS